MRKPIDFSNKKVTIDVDKVLLVINARLKPEDRINAKKFAKIMGITNQSMSIYKNIDTPIAVKVVAQMAQMSGLRIEEFLIIKPKKTILIPQNKKNE